VTAHNSVRARNDLVGRADTKTMKRTLLLATLAAMTTFGTACGVESRSKILIPTMPGAIPGVQVEPAVTAAPAAVPTSHADGQSQEPVH
jgi:hypothetical protein